MTRQSSTLARDSIQSTPCPPRSTTTPRRNRLPRSLPRNTSNNPTPLHNNPTRNNMHRPPCPPPRRTPSPRGSPIPPRTAGSMPFPMGTRRRGRGSIRRSGSMIPFSLLRTSFPPPFSLSLRDSLTMRCFSCYSFVAVFAGFVALSAITIRQFVKYNGAGGGFGSDNTGSVRTLD